MNWQNIPVFNALEENERQRLADLAQTINLSAGDVLFYQGDPATKLYLLSEGTCQISINSREAGAIDAPALLDDLASLGGLRHTIKISASDEVSLLCWEADTLWQNKAFATQARRYLAEALQAARTERDQLAAPVHFDEQAILQGGAFRFDNTAMIFAFCEAENTELVQSWLPQGLSLVNRPAKSTSPILVALADFPRAYPEADENALFAYTETTFFIPVRHQTAFGFYVPLIYPSTYNPILLGREIYGFPKRLGQTVFSSHQVELKVADNNLNLGWGQGEAVSETRLVRGLFDWLGLGGLLASVAFQAGEVLRIAGRLPAYRRVDVYNHKRIPAANTTRETPLFSVNQLTRATFGVLHWHHITQMQETDFAVQGHTFEKLGLSLREAYRTKLDMRLSTGRVVHDYGADA